MGLPWDYLGTTMGPPQPHRSHGGPAGQLNKCFQLLKRPIASLCPPPWWCPLSPLPIGVQLLAEGQGRDHASAAQRFRPHFPLTNHRAAPPPHGQSAGTSLRPLSLSPRGLSPPCQSSRANQ